MSISTDALDDQVVEMAQEKDMVITSVEDIVCYKAGNFEVPSFLERPGTL